MVDKLKEFDERIPTLKEDPGFDDMIPRRYCNEQRRLHTSTDLGMSESSHSHKMTEALNRLKATLKWLGLID